MKFLNIFLCLCSMISAQERLFRTYSVEDGLSQNSVYAIEQDSNGFMWFGTADGLNRFDGYSFTIYRPVPGDQNSIHSTFNRNILSLNSHSLVIGHENGLSIYDQLRDRFSKIPVEHQNFGTTDIYDLCVDHRDRLWYITPGGVFRLDWSDSSSSKISVDNNEREMTEGFGSYSLFIDRSNRLWLCASVGLFLYDESSDRFKTFSLVDRLDDEFRTVVQDARGTLWFGTGHGNVFSVPSDLSTVTSYSEILFGEQKRKQNLITQMVIDRIGRLWIGTYEQGLYSFDPANGSVDHFTHDISNPSSITFDIIRSLFIDSNDNLWIGTDGGGLSLLPLFPKKFNLITHRRNEKNSLADTFVKGVYQDERGIIWVGTAKGLNRYDPEKDSASLFIPHPNLSNATSNQIFSISEDVNGKLWLSTSYGISSFDRVKNSFAHFPMSHPAYHLKLPTVVYHTHYSDSMIWIASHSILTFNTRTGIYSQPAFFQEQLLRKAFLLPYWDSRGRFWGGSSLFGMYRIDPERNSLTILLPVPNDSNSISSTGMRCVYEESNGIYWIGSVNGLNRYDETKNSFTRYFEKDGLPSAFIYGILPDANGRLWMSTNNGLSRFDPVSGRFRNFTVHDGIQSAEFNTGAYFRNPRNGFLFFGGINGVTYFHPDSITDSQFSPPIVLTDVRKFDRTAVSLKPFHRLRSLELPYDENTISFAFAAMDFSNPEQVRYSYRLEGFEHEWIDAGNRREVRYTNLESGDYYFRVKATNADGVNGRNELVLFVRIVPPYWQTMWFRILSVMMLIGSIIGAVRYSAHRKYRALVMELEQQQRIMEERQRTRDKIARDLHDDLASTVGSAGLFIETAKRTMLEDTAQAKEYLEKTSSILNEAEEAMSDIVWSVSPKHDTLHSLSTRVRLVTTELCRAHGVGYSVDVKGNADIPLSEDLRRGLYLIFKEALNNCLKHSDATKIEIGIGIEGEKLVLHVKDNGRGLPDDGTADTLGGNGVFNIRKRAEEIGAAVEITSVPGQGVDVRVEKQLTR